MNFKNIIAEKQGKVGIITLNQPASLNVLTAEMMEETAEALHTFETDEDVSVIVLKGNEESFSTGLNFQEIANESSARLLQDPFFDKKWTAVADAKKPVIAAVSGYVLGMGLDLMMMCDIIIASDTAVFGFPEMTVALVSGVGGIARLKQRIGFAQASDMILTGKMLTAQEALANGLISRVVPKVLLEKDAYETAERISSFSLPVLQLAKKALKEGEAKSDDRYFNACFALADTKEGIQASLEKRKPMFQNK